MEDVMEPVSTMSSYWGKARNSDAVGPPYHLLPYHSLDVAAVAAEWWERVPHACGDEPGITPPTRPSRRCSPRMWGWTVAPWRLRDLHNVFPTYGRVRRRGIPQSLSAWHLGSAPFGAPQRRPLAATPLLGRTRTPSVRRPSCLTPPRAPLSSIPV